MNEQVTMTLSSGWRFLTPEEYSQLGPLADDPSVRLVAVASTKDEGNVPTFVVTGGALSTDASDDDVYADTIRQVKEALPGFHLIVTTSPGRSRLKAHAGALASTFSIMCH